MYPTFLTRPSSIFIPPPHPDPHLLHSLLNGLFSTLPFLPQMPSSLDLKWDFLVVQKVEHLPAVQETRVQSLGREDPPEKGMAAHSSVLA